MILRKRANSFSHHFPLKKVLFDLLIRQIFRARGPMPLMLRLSSNFPLSYRLPPPLSPLAVFVLPWNLPSYRAPGERFSKFADTAVAAWRGGDASFPSRLRHYRQVGGRVWHSV